MKMKPKPDTSQFRIPKDPTAFLEGGSADQAAQASESIKPSSTSTSDVEQARRRSRGNVAKVFHFPEEMADRLRDEATIRTRLSGARVSEKDIVLRALELYFQQTTKNT